MHEAYWFFRLHFAFLKPAMNFLNMACVLEAPLS